MNDKVEDIEIRIAKLERTTALYRRALFLLAILCATVLLLAVQGTKDHSSRVVTRELVIVDENGRDAIVLTAKGAHGSMQFRRADGTSELVLSASALTMTPDSHSSATLYSGGPTGPALSLLGRNSIVMTAEDARGPLIEMADEAGYKTAVGRVVLADKLGAQRHTTSAAAITMFKPDKSVLWSAPRR